MASIIVKDDYSCVEVEVDSIDTCQEFIVAMMKVYAKKTYVNDLEVIIKNNMIGDSKLSIDFDLSGDIEYEGSAPYKISYDSCED